ncbi:MAG: response regulator transcription factor [Chloroflexi bacterium]|nr:response regulator transcription factor [Chloroflexota bacterium]
MPELESPESHILVVDDDAGICALLKRGLSYEGFSVDVARDGHEALAKAREHEPDLAVLDVLMPGMDGVDLAKRLRQGSTFPIIMVTAKGALADKVAGFTAGADDYIVKPFDFDELLLRIRSLLRRCRPDPGEIIRFHDLTMNVDSREVSVGEAQVHLSAREFDLLHFFMQNQGKVLSRRSLYEHVWGYDFGSDSNVIEVYVRYVRAKLEDAGCPGIIHTVRGVGYILKG